MCAWERQLNDEERRLTEFKAETIGIYLSTYLKNKCSCQLIYESCQVVDLIAVTVLYHCCFKLGNRIGGIPSRMRRRKSETLRAQYIHTKELRHEPFLYLCFLKYYLADEMEKL